MAINSNIFSADLFYAYLRNLGIELILLILSEMTVRFIIPSHTRRLDRMRLCIIHCCILAVASLILHLFHYKPLLLLVSTITIFFRFLLVYSNNPDDRHDRHISKPLRRMNTMHNVVPFQLNQFVSDDTVAGGNEVAWPQSNSGTSLVPRQGVMGNGRNKLHNSYHNLNSTQQSPAHTTGFPRNTWRTSLPSVSFAASNPLSRSPLKGSSTAVDQPSIPYTHQSYLKYVSSFWGKPKPSECPPGIVNTGNVCFITSILHSLAWTPRFIEKLRTVCKPRDESNSLVSAKLQLLRSLCAVLDKCCVLPDGSNTYDSVDSSQFLKQVSESVPYLVAPPHRSQRQTQQDASEFLLWLLDNLDGSKANDPSHLFESTKQERAECFVKLQNASSDHLATYKDPLTELAKADWILQGKEASFLTHELFLGQMIEARACQKCQKLSVNVEYFTVLPLPIPNSRPHSVHLSLIDCFDMFITVEELTSSNMMVCSCSSDGSKQEEMILTPGNRLAMLSRLPKRMVIQLSRFSYNAAHKSAQKNTIPIIIPKSIDITPYLLETKLNSNGSSSEMYGKAVYSLYAVCIHTGAQSTSYGHYISYCKAFNGIWYCFNDSYVSVVTDMVQELLTPVMLQNAYLLLYSVDDIQ